MHTSTGWLLSDRVILTTYCDIITKEHIAIEQETVLHILNGVSHPTHLVIEVSAGRQFSSDLASLKTIRQYANPILRHANLGWVIVVDPTPHPVFKMIGYTLTQVARKQLYICGSRDHALEFLYSKDDSLNSATT